MSIGVIYLATNIINGKMYVGKTISLNHRKWKHKSVAYNKNTNDIKRFHKGIKKLFYETTRCD